MTTKILRISGILCLAFGCFAPLFSQVATVQLRNVPSENIDEFIKRETTYWSEVARHAIKAGKLQGWELWRRVGGMDLPGEHNFAFRNVFAKWEDLDDMAGVWDSKKVFPDVDPAQIETWSMGTVTDQLFFQIHAGISKTPPKAIRVNFAKATDVLRYIELEQTLWQPFLQGQMDAKKTNVVSWGLMRLVIPGGTDRPYNAVTVDGFETLSGALSPNFGDTPETPAFNEVFDSHQKTSIQIYVLIKAVSGAE